MIFVYDRTGDDVRLKTSKGYINVSDLNRIEGNIKAISDALNSLAYRQSCNVRTDWECGGFVRANADLERIRTNLSALKSAFFVYDDTPDIPESYQGMTYETANGIEKLLADLWNMLGDARKRFRECGTFNCGEENDL